MLSHPEMIARIVVGSALGGVIGYERDRHGRPVGLRTHLIVAMASATFMVISAEFVYYQHYRATDLVAVDTSRIAASVVSGIGFLAGGAILRTGFSIQGLTTAAGLWLVTAIGMSAGAGMFVESGVVTVLGITALTLLRRFEDKDDSILRRRLSVVLAENEAGSAGLLTALTAFGAVASDVEYTRSLGSEQTIEVILDVRFPARNGVPKLMQAVEAVPGVRQIHIERRG